MRSDISFRPLRLEELDRREAPAVLTVTPPAAEGHGPGVITATVADQGCENGVDANAAGASGGVVRCA